MLNTHSLGRENRRQPTFHIILVLAVLLATAPDAAFSANIDKLKRKAESGDAKSQYELGRAYSKGKGVKEHDGEAARWYKKAALQGHADAQYELGRCYDKGKGVEEDEVEAVRWYERAGRQGHAKALYELGHQYFFGSGKVPLDRVRAYAFWSLAADRGHFWARGRRNLVSRQLSRNQIATAIQIATRFMKGGPPGTPNVGTGRGTCFFITTNGYLVTNHHVVIKTSKITVIQRKKRFRAKMIASDAQNDLALLKVEGVFQPLPIISTKSVTLGLSVLTVGHPLSDSLGDDPTLTKGIVSRLSGYKGSKNSLQVSAQIQPGSSGSALLNEKGEVIGVMQSSLVAARRAAAVPQNVNFAIKSDHLLNLIRMHPDVFKAIVKANPNSKQSFQKAVNAAVQSTARLEVDLD